MGSISASKPYTTACARRPSTPRDRSISEGGRVIILEDVTTTGGSAIKAVKRIEEETECEVVAVISILDREEGGKEAFNNAGIHFESLLVRSDISG